MWLEEEGEREKEEKRRKRDQDTSTTTIHGCWNCCRTGSRKPTSLVADSLTFPPLAQRFSTTRRCQRKPKLRVCFVLEDEELKAQLVRSEEEAQEREKVMAKRISDVRTVEKLARKRSASSFGTTCEEG